jgi:UDP-GlcNAc:undecaprenyl-phosphate GlcNAc-1-phosphate transferase
MYDIILSFLTAFTVTFFAIPSIINISNVKALFDEPNERSSHKRKIPSLGGIGIFAGFIFAIVFWTPFNVFEDLQYIICAFLLIFLIGAKDDILPMSPMKKMVGEILAACILVFKSNLFLGSFFGIFGIYELPYWLGVLFTIFTIVVIINAFNLIDGINGLAGFIGLIISSTFGIWFLAVDRIELSIVAFSMAGAVIAFLHYNFSPAKIFMGDTGSLILGLNSSILALKYIELNNAMPDSLYAIKSVPAVTIGILIIPLFDTIRVFILRILRGRSPFYPDKTHIHHLLIDLGYSHVKSTLILCAVNILFIGISLRFQDIGTLNLIWLILTLATIGSVILLYLANKKIKQESNKL